MFGLQTVCFFSSLFVLAWCQNNTSPPQIIGGEDAVYGEFPYQCRLWMSNFFCGAVIYNERTILTAGHCAVVDGPIPGNDVRCGVNVLSPPVDEFEVQRKVVKIIRHPKYDTNFGIGYPYDVAVMHLDAPLVFNDFVRPVPLYDGVSRIPRDCVLTGWGTTSDTSGGSDVLQKTTARYMSRGRCQKLWNTVALFGVTDLNVCFIDLVGPSAPTNPSCGGDSGGPAVCGGVLVGLTSWGVEPCEQPLPVVYSAISKFKTWIEANALTDLKRSTVVV